MMSFNQAGLDKGQAKQGKEKGLSNTVHIATVTNQHKMSSKLLEWHLRKGWHQQVCIAQKTEKMQVK